MSQIEVRCGDTDDHLWSGDSDQFSADNDRDPEIVDALVRLSEWYCNEVYIGGGAAPLIRVIKTDQAGVL